MANWRRSSSSGSTLHTQLFSVDWKSIILKKPLDILIHDKLNPLKKFNNLVKNLSERKREKFCPGFFSLPTGLSLFLCLCLFLSLGIRIIILHTPWSMLMEWSYWRYMYVYLCIILWEIQVQVQAQAFPLCHFFSTLLSS